MLDPRGPKPLYTQLEELLRQKMESGGWLAHQAIPSEQELSTQFGLARMTVRHALSRLVQDGLLYRVPGKGTYVAEPKLVSPALGLSGLRDQLQQGGYETETRLLVAEERPADLIVARHLNLLPGQPVYVVQRLRLANQVPIASDTSFLPSHLFPGLPDYDLGSRSLYHVLQHEYRVVPRRGREILEASVVKETDAGTLQVSPGTGLFRLQIEMFTDADMCFEYVQVLIRGDRVRLRIDLSHSGLLVVPETASSERG